MVLFAPLVQHGQETLCYTQRVTDAPSFNIYTGREDPNNPIKWEHSVPPGILNSVVRVGLYIEAWDVDYPPDGDEYDRVYINGYDLGLLEGSNDSWFTVEKTVPVAAIREGINNLEVHVDEAGKTWKVTIRASELRFYCSTSDPDFSLGVTPESHELNAGESGSSTVAIVGLNNFNSPVTLSLSGLPTGAAVNFGSNPITPSPTAQTGLEITTTGSTPAGDYTLTLKAEGGGKTHTAQMTLKINNTGTPDPDYTVETEPNEQTIYPGDSTEYKIKITPLNGFSDGIYLDINGLPDGAEAIFRPQTVQPDKVSVLTITTKDNIPLGTHKMKIYCHGGGIHHKAEITLKVEERPPDPDFLLEANPSNRDVTRGESTDYTITLKPLNDFTGSVDLSIENLPGGVTAQFNPTNLEENGSSTLTVTTSAAAPTGTHTLTVKGVSGELEHTLNVGLTIKCPDFAVQIKADNDSGSAPLAVAFESNINNAAFPLTEYTYRWNFGDGVGSEEPNPSHTFQTPGRQTVKLTVTDPCGQSRSASKTIEVDAFEGDISTSFSVSGAMPGDELYINIRVQNKTRTEFNNIRVKNPLAASLEYIGDTSGAAPVRSGNELSWQFPVLKKKDTFTFKIKVKVAEDAQPGTVTNMAYLSHDSLAQPMVSNTASLTLRKIDITLRKQVEQTEAKPGDVIKYQLTLKNNAAVPATGVKLTDELSHHLEFVSQTGKLGFNRGGNTLKWTGTIEPSEQIIIIFKARVRSDVFSGTQIENTAQLEADKLKEPLESDTVTTLISADPISTGSIRFTKRAEVPQAEVGRIVRFNITTINNSYSAIVSPVIEDHLPQGFAYVPGSTLLNNQHYDEPQGKRRLLWQLPVIQPGQTVTLRYQVVIGADARRGRNTNRALLRAKDNSGQDLYFEDSAFVNVSSDGFIFYSGLEGTVFLDRDYDRFYSMSDTPLENIEVVMSNGQKAFTDRMGQYRFENLFPGEYAVSVNRATLPENLRAGSTVPKIVTLSDGLTDHADFAIKFTKDNENKTARFEGRVFFDRNGNNTYDNGDNLVEQFEATLDNAKKSRCSNGRFVFTHLKKGNHEVVIRYEGLTVRKTVTLTDGNNLIEFPLEVTGIRVIVGGAE